MDSPHNGLETRKMFQFDDVIIIQAIYSTLLNPFNALPLSDAM